MYFKQWIENEKSSYEVGVEFSHPNWNEGSLSNSQGVTDMAQEQNNNEANENVCLPKFERKLFRWNRIWIRCWSVCYIRGKNTKNSFLRKDKKPKILPTQMLGFKTSKFVEFPRTWSSVFGSFWSIRRWSLIRSAYLPDLAPCDLFFFSWPKTEHFVDIKGEKRRNKHLDKCITAQREYFQEDCCLYWKQIISMTFVSKFRLFLEPPIKHQIK